MQSIIDTQTIQLRLVESAAVSESCATDLLDILPKLSLSDAKSIVCIIENLRCEAWSLRALSKALTSRLLIETGR